MTEQKQASLAMQHRAAEVRPTSFKEADNTIEVIWTTGAPVRRYSYAEGVHYQEVLEMTPEAVDLVRLNTGGPFLAAHDSSTLASVIGTVVPGTARLAGDKGLATIKLSNAPEDAGIIGKIRDGIIRNISVGYFLKKVQRIDHGAGNDEEWRVVSWEPYEISAVPIPADVNAQVRSDERQHPVEIVATDEETSKEIRARMLKKHRETIGVTDAEIIGAARSHSSAGHVSADLVYALEIGRAAAEAHVDPVEAANVAFRTMAGRDAEDQGAAFAAAYIFASVN